MNYRPILFNTPMVCAIEDGTKTQTRRLVQLPKNKDWELLDVRPNPDLPGRFWQAEINGTLTDVKKRFTLGIKAPCVPGDVLWVRETWMPVTDGYLYYTIDHVISRDNAPIIWSPSIHMPKAAARIFLRVESVRAERLKSISPFNAMDEGFADWNDFVSGWNDTIPKGKMRKYGWDANPWVWVIVFERIEKPEGWPNL